MHFFDDLVHYELFEDNAIKKYWQADHILKFV